MEVRADVQVVIRVRTSVMAAHVKTKLMLGIGLALACAIKGYQ